MNMLDDDEEKGGDDGDEIEGDQDMQSDNEGDDKEAERTQI